MELKEFVKQSLIEICEGIKEAQQYIAENKVAAYVNHPNYASTRPGSVEFDIAVTVVSSDKNDASGKLTIVGVFKAGGGIESSTENSSVSRLKFDIPVRYPTQGEYSV